MSAPNRTLVSPAQASAHIASRFASEADAQKFLVTYAGTGKIYVQADSTEVAGGDPVLGKRIDAVQFRNLKGKAPTSFWRAATWTAGSTDFVGIRVSLDDVDRVAGEYGSTFSAHVPDLRASVGGRSSGKHGQPIAALALAYAVADDRALNRLTGSGLALDLKKLYIDLGFASPSEDNLDSICVGIVKALKAHRHANPLDPQKT